MKRDEGHVEFVQDRPGHDYRYALDNAKIHNNLAWSPETEFSEGIKKTVTWYQKNEWWWRPLKTRLRSASKGYWQK